MLAQFGTRSIDMFPILEEFLKNNLREPRFSLKKNMVKFFKYKKILSPDDSFSQLNLRMVNFLQSDTFFL